MMRVALAIFSLYGVIALYNQPEKQLRSHYTQDIVLVPGNTAGICEQCPGTFLRNLDRLTTAFHSSMVGVCVMWEEVLKTYTEKQVKAILMSCC